MGFYLYFPNQQKTWFSHCKVCWGHVELQSQGGIVHLKSPALSVLFVTICNDLWENLHIFPGILAQLEVETIHCLILSNHVDHITSHFSDISVFYSSEIWSFNALYCNSWGCVCVCVCMWIFLKRGQVVFRLGVKIDRLFVTLHFQHWFVTKWPPFSPAFCNSKEDWFDCFPHCFHKTKRIYLKRKKNK